MPSNNPNDPRYNRGGLGGSKPRVRAQAGSGRGGALAPRQAPGVPSAGSGGGAGASGGGGSGSGGGQPPSPRGGGGQMPQGGGRVPAPRGGSMPMQRPGVEAPRGSTWGGDLTGSANRGDLPPPRGERPGVPARRSRILDNLMYEALRDKSSPAGALFRMMLRALPKAAGGAAGAASLAADSTPLNQGEATERPQGDSPYPNAMQEQRGQQAMANSQLPVDFGSESGGSAQGAPKPTQKPKQSSGGDSQPNGQQGSQPSENGSEATLPDNASLGDKIAFGREKGWPVIEHEGRVYVQDPNSPTGYKFGGELQQSQQPKQDTQQAQQSGYSLNDFMQDVREGPSEEEAARIQERFGGGSTR